VTEPYIDEAGAKAVAFYANEAMAGWGVDVHALPSDRSSWNPGHCPPIVAVFTDMSMMIKYAVPWALGVQVETVPRPEVVR
jgi:hypothetical protein